MLERLELVKTDKMEKVKILTFDFESQSLTCFKFKCDLNLKKTNADSCSRGRN